MLHIRIHKALFFTFFLMLFGCIADLQATTYKVQTVAKLKARVEAKYKNSIDTCCQLLIN